MPKEPISRSFNSEEELNAHAEESYSIGEKRVNAKEISLGLDITDIDSVMKFNIGYIPMQNNVIVKEIPKDLLKQDDNKILAYDLSQEAIRYYVFAVSSRVVDVKKGDIVAIGDPQSRSVPAAVKILKGIKFLEIAYYHIQGVVSNDENLVRERIRINDTSNIGIVLTGA